MIESVEKIYNDDNDFMCYMIHYENSDKKTAVPDNPDNRHYQEIMNWVAEGNTITDPQE